MTATEYAQWYYLIFLVPGGAALVTLCFAFLGMGQGDGDSDGDADGDADSGGDADGGDTDAGDGADADADGGDGDADAQGDSDDAGDAESDANDARSNVAGLRTSAGRTGTVRTAAAGGPGLGWLGFGRVPSSFVWGSLLLGWGIVGFWTTRGLQSHLPAPVFVLPAVAAAIAGAIALATGFSAMVVRLAPKHGAPALRTIDLVGLTGKVSYPVDRVRGRITVYDPHGTMHDCSARTARDETIARGAKVLIVDYDPQTDRLVVEERP